MHPGVSSVLTRHSGSLFFIVMSLGALIWFASAVLDIGHQLWTLPEIISFNKSIFYLPGIGIGLGALSVAAVYQYWLKRPLSNRLSRVITQSAIAGLLVTFVLPHLIHYPVASYLQARGYTVCQEASHQWLHSRIIVFANNRSTCKEIAVQMK